MKIICLIPSISETLIAFGVNLVGRSRFCIHPQAAVSDIPAIGGTKDVDWSKAASLQPDLVILDKEENTLAMAESCPFDYIALHITSIDTLADELQRLAKRINNIKLEKIARRWHQIAQNPRSKTSLKKIPGIIEWWRNVEQQSQFIYLIWRDPWMAIGNQTFIQSVLDHCGLQDARVQLTQKYPEISLQHYDPKNTLLLFSSEPYPFARYREQLTAHGFACGLIDGEKYSWYGVRTLLFLESLRTG